MTTIINLFENSVSKYTNNNFLWEKKNDKYQPTTYKETLEQVQVYAAGLLSLGIKKEDRVALLSEGRNYWVTSELAILYTGAVNVPLSIKLEESDLKFRLEHSGTKAIIVSNNQAKKLKKIKADLPNLEKVIYLDAQESYEDYELFIDDIVKKGEDYLKNNQETVEQIKNSIEPNDLANISYTSGTTADPKGIMLTHRNYTANVEQACSLMYIPENYVTLTILPLDHSFAHTAGAGNTWNV